MIKIHYRINISQHKNCSQFDLASYQKMEAVDPFKHRLQLTRWDWFRTYILTVVLVPIRVLLFSIFLLLMYLVSITALISIDQKIIMKKPFTSTGIKIARKIVVFLARVAFGICGFSITVKGEVAPFKKAPIIVGAPHCSFIDNIAVFCYCNASSTILAEEVFMNLPIVGKIFQLFQPIYVSRKDPNSKENVRNEILRRVDSVNEGWSQISLSPEGMCSNRKALLPFKLGAFYPGKPILPFCARYHNRLDTVTWTWDQPHGAKTILWLTLAQPVTRIELDFLPVYYPTTREKEDPILYASNMRKLMAAHLNIGTYDITLDELKKKYGKNIKKNN